MKTILVVDDSATSRLLFKAHMPKEGDYRIVEAANLEQAMERVGAEHPDLVFLDYNMPGKNGVEIARTLADAGVEATCFLLTANTQQSVLAAAQEAGIRGVLEKPITRAKLEQALTEAGF